MFIRTYVNAYLYAYTYILYVHMHIRTHVCIHMRKYIEYNNEEVIYVEQNYAYTHNNKWTHIRKYHIHI